MESSTGFLLEDDGATTFNVEAKIYLKFNWIKVIFILWLLLPLFFRCGGGGVGVFDSINLRKFKSGVPVSKGELSFEPGFWMAEMPRSLPTGDNTGFGDGVLKDELTDSGDVFSTTILFESEIYLNKNNFEIFVSDVNTVFDQN